MTDHLISVAVGLIVLFFLVLISTFMAPLLLVAGVLFIVWCIGSLARDVWEGGW